MIALLILAALLLGFVVWISPLLCWRQLKKVNTGLDVLIGLLDNEDSE